MAGVPRHYRKALFPIEFVTPTVDVDKHNGTCGEFERTSILIFIEEFYLLLTFLRPGLQCSPLIFILFYLRGASSQIVVSEVSQTLLTIATLLEYY